MKKSALMFKILDHPADLKIKAWGKNLNDLIDHVLEAIQSGIKPEISNKKIKTEIKISDKRLEDLFFKFLEELVYQMDVNDALYLKGDFKKINENEINGFLVGKRVKRFTTEIKGATWYDFEIKKIEKGGFEATLVLDL